MKRLVLALIVATSTVYAAGPTVRCDAVQSGKRTLATVELSRFFDRELLRLVRLGLEGRVRATLVLVRRRAMWFDDDVLTVTRAALVTWDKQRRVYLLDGAPVTPEELDTLRLERILLGRRDANTAGSHYVEVEVEVEVVTVKSMLNAARWVTGRDSGEGDLITTQLAKVVVSDLARSASDSCNVR